MAEVTYTAGTVSASKNAFKVYGQNTAWLANDIKAKDLLVIGGNVYEIASVEAATELTVTIAIKATVTTTAYTIVRVSDQVLAPDIAKRLYECVDKYDTDMKEISDFFETSGFYIDTDGDIAQV